MSAIPNIGPTIKAIVNTGPGQLELQDKAWPVPTETQVRIRTLACGICATDLEMIAGCERGAFPRILGHEWCGLVDGAGGAAGAKLTGIMCVGENVFPDGDEIGFERPGGYAEYFMTTASRIYPLPDTMDPAAACLIEPLAVCVRGLSRLKPEPGGSTLILGDGPIGLLTVMLLHAKGITDLVLVGGQPVRLGLAEELTGCRILNYHELSQPLGPAIVRDTGSTFATIIEASGSGAAIQAAQEAAANGARILVLGDYKKQKADFPWNRLLHKELELIGSNASAGAWPEAVALAEKLPLHRLVSTRLPVAQFLEAIELVRTARDQVKVVLQWEPGQGRS